MLTDRGTYDYLLSGTTDPAGKITHLSVVTRDNGATAPGGADALINYFHAYIINQAKVQSATNSTAPTVNLPAAQDLITLLTSPAFQASLKNYLSLAHTPAQSTNHVDACAIDPGARRSSATRRPALTESGLSG